MLRRELRAGLARLLGGGLDQSLGMRGVGRVFPATSWPAPPSAGLEPRADLVRLQADAPEDRLGYAAGTEQGEEDVLRADGIVPQLSRFIPRLGERLLGALAQRMRLDAGCGVGAQSGLASSMSMIGMPSSTA